MEWLVKCILVGYFILFIALALLYRSYRVYKLTGINALNQSPTDGALKIIAFILRFHLLLVSGLIIDYVFDLGFLTINRFAWLSSIPNAEIGSFLLMLCLALIISAQIQMSSSWRIEIDSINKAQLITGGLFKYSRNPIFVAIRLGYFAIFLIIPCPYAAITFLISDICFQLQVRKEEEHLQKVYGEDYLEYCSQVRRWL